MEIDVCVITDLNRLWTLYRFARSGIKRFLEKLRNKTDEYNSFMDGIYSSLESSLHSLNIEGYLKL